MILDGLNPEQRAAAEAVRGRVCILAGAGTGKTTTVTHRIAHQVSCGAFAASQVLAVTFTEKAAGELKSRLAALGSPGVRASTFHSAALAQLRHFVPDARLQILPSKASLLRQIGNRLPGAYRFRPAGDLATEIEWAKNRRIPPERYLASTRDRMPPIPHDLMFGVYREYERRKADAGLLDFEDLLGRAVALYEENEGAAREFRERYRAFTVDEYQDVNGLQQRLLELWLGEREDLCAVGDDYQAIYGFTGAGPEHLLAFSRTAQVFRLELNYRSTAQVLALANRLVPQLEGAPKILRPASGQGEGPEPELAGFASWVDEGDRLVQRIRALHEAGVSYEQQAVLVRTNARSADVEEVLHAAGLPFQGASLLDREGARSLLKRLRGARGPAADAVREVALSLGWESMPVEDLGEREQTRQSDLGRIVAIAAQLADVAELAPELERRFGASVATGVHLLTLHRSKGLEWDAVFLPRLDEGELPIRRGDIDEERRLLYVGLTRARRHLFVSWSAKPSRFLSELGVEKGASRRPAPRAELTAVGTALREWRLERARADGVPAYVVFHDRTLAEIEDARPSTIGELAAISGVGPVKIDRYGEELLAVLSR